MAAMVAANGSLVPSPISSKDKCSRNKRKFPADSPMLDTSDPSMVESPFPDYEPFPSEPFSHDLEKHVSTCNTCRALTHSLKEALDMEDVRDMDWSGMPETQLEELLLSNLDAIHKNAIRKITSYGYKESVAINALLKIGRSCCNKDPVADIAEHALEYLASGKVVDICETENAMEQIRKLEKGLLDEMICVLREVRPVYTRGDAMWSLLMCDMEISNACSFDSETYSSLGYNEVSGASTAQPIAEHNSDASMTSIISASSVPSDKMNPSSIHPQSSAKSEMPTLAGVPGLPSSRFYAPGNIRAPNFTSDPSKEYPASKSLEENLFSHALAKPSLPREKPVGSKKPLGGSSKSRYRSNHLERNNRVHGYRSTSRLAKNSNLANLLLEKNKSTGSGSVSIDPKSSSLKLGKTVELAASQSNTIQNFSFTAGSSFTSSGTDKVIKSPLVPTANTDASLPVSTNCGEDGNIGLYVNSEGLKSRITSSFLNHEGNSNWTSFDPKDEMLVKVIPHFQELKAQLQGWTDWAQQKVMQAARRLNKDKNELQTLRQERAEATRLLREKEALEASMMKKVTETEYAWSKACAQYEISNATMGRLENENNKLRQTLEIAKAHATELAANCQEASTRENMALKKIHSWEREKVTLNEELAAKKHKLLQLAQQLEVVKEYHDQTEDKWKQEEKAKHEALTQVTAERNEREEIEASAKLEEAALLLKRESALQRYTDDVRALENQIEKLRIFSSMKAPALSWDINTRSTTDVMDSQESGDEELQRDRECVMCLTEEMSIVFLPCSHQVVCAKCNELHEKQGMKDCPSCRALIQRRIHVRSAYT